MRIISINQLKKTLWYREGGAMALFYIQIPYLGQFKNLYYGVFYCKKFVGHGYYNKEAMEKTARLVFRKQIQNKKFIDKLIKKWKKAKNIQDKFLDSLRNHDFKILTDKQLITLYKKFNKTRENLWNQTGFLLEVFNEYDLVLLNELLTKLNQKLDPDEITILTTPTTPTFIFKAKKDFLKLYQKFKEKDKDLNEELDKYVQNYFWLNNNWAFIHYLDKKYFLKQLQTTNYQKLIQEIKENEKYLISIKKKQKDIIRKYKLRPELKNFFYLLRQLGTWREERKKQTLKENGWADKFLKEFSRRNKINHSLLKYVSPYYFENKIDISSRFLKKLKKQEVLIVGKDFKNWKIFYGRRARKIWKIIEQAFLPKNKILLKGRTANPGLVKGIVKLVFTYRDFSKINQGDILVTQMTRPEFAPLFKKVKGIITDEGGITCHAAIVARELKIPCIIGTQIATKILKDGDLAEVDAEKGVVKIIKRKH